MAYRIDIADDFSAKVKFGTEDGETFLPVSYINIPSYAYMQIDWSGEHFASDAEVEQFVSGYAQYLREESFPIYDDESTEVTTERFCMNYEDKQFRMRQQRNNLLAETDWTQAPDSPLSDALKTSWATYRTQLRDLSTNANWPFLQFDDWPTKP